MNVLLLSLGGGGGNILRSLKAIFHRDLAETAKVDAAYADRLQQRIATRFLDTNEFSLADVPPEERLLIGAGTTRRLGSRHNPEIALTALEESRSEVEAVVASYAATVLIATGGKGTGAGTIFPVAEMARRHKKLVIPVFVCPSFERHEVEKRRYDHARKVIDRFDRAGIRLIEILNDRGYTDDHPQPQSVVWERMNLPIARSLRGLLYVLEDLSQVDPSDLSALFAGPGRLRLAFGEIDPPAAGDPTAEQVDAAVRACWENPYDAFGRAAGTSLICIQGHWSNVVDARIKGRFRSIVAGDTEAYNPLYARAMYMPKPWGVTALFAEHTGNHPPIDITWPLDEHQPSASRAPETREPAVSGSQIAAAEAIAPAEAVANAEATFAPADATLAPAEPIDADAPPPAPTFAGLWDFARSVNRGDAAALALAERGPDDAVRIGAEELRKLITTVWFRSVFERLSQPWRERLFDAVLHSLPVTNHPVRIGRQSVPLSESTRDQLNDIAMRGDLADAVRSEVLLLAAIGRLWGEDALRRCQYTAPPAVPRFDAQRVRSLLSR